jgi:hypothetical protein
MVISHKEMVAAGIGFLVASIIPPAILAVIWPLGGKLDLSSVIITFYIAYPFSVAAVLVFGLPTFLLLRRFRPGQWWSVIFIGLFLGCIVAIAIGLPSLPDLHDFATMSPLGALSALAFWLIWKRGVSGTKNDKEALDPKL